MLRRLGCKKKLLPRLLDLFPAKVGTFIDLFMGTGAVTFAMQDRADFVFSNDNDAEVFNLFMVAKDRRADLLDALAMMPVHESLFQYWRHAQEPDPVWRSVRFLMLSNFGFLGGGVALRCLSGHDRETLRKEIDGLQDTLDKTMFLCCDFREVLNKVSFRHPEREKPMAFIYADPPYLGTGNNYQNGFTEQDTADLFRILVESGMRFALSEFAHPVVMELVNVYKLHVTYLGERRTLKNRQTELLITNYEPHPRQPSLFQK
jgi:DNA adenine methylase